jgi:Beta-galactosidase
MIDPQQYGVTFSIKQCQNFDIDPIKTLDWLINDAGFRRFRLMSYWNEIEKEQGVYDFTELDRQIDAIEKAGGIITLCLGARQPRWPENHWPSWAWEASKPERTGTLLAFIKTVVLRYRNRAAIVSYQLENEALLENFGEKSEVDRARLRNEYQLVKRLDPDTPIIMTTSTSWGVPVRRPIPDLVGFSYYHTLWRNGDYHHSTLYPWIHRWRKYAIRLLHWKPTFIHELQCEPWGPTAIWKMSIQEQDQSMSPQHIATNVRLAKAIKAAPIDLWGGEWWYWRLTTHNDASIWEAVRHQLTLSNR